MSEYNPNDHLHNVTASVMQITRQAQGVQDITGAYVADYEQISPDAAESVTLVNARTDVPFLELINNFPPVQDGSGTPSPDNVRVLIPYTSSKITDGDNNIIYNVELPESMYGGYVDYVNRRIVLDIVRVRLRGAGVEWIDATGGVYYINSSNPSMPEYVKNVDDRYLTGENCEAIWGQASNLIPGRIVLRAAIFRIYYTPPELAEVSTLEELLIWLDENPIYFYYRLATPVIVPLDTSVLYIPDASYTLTAESGTLSIKYQGLPPEEP